MKMKWLNQKKEGTTMETIGRDISGLPGSEPLEPETLCLQLFCLNPKP